MPSEEDIAIQLNLLATHRRTLSLYLQQKATIGSAYIPPAIYHGIHETREQIRHIKTILHEWGVSIENYPDDEEALLSEPTPPLAEFMDVPINHLGHPRPDDIGARFRAVHDYATRNGFAGAFPTFHEANKHLGIVYGVVLLKSVAAEFKDVLISELDNPPPDDAAARIRAANDYAAKNGFVGAFPTFHEANSRYGIILLKTFVAEFRDIPIYQPNCYRYLPKDG